ncbi:MAG: outer membrane protein assembly factor BamD [Magnetococcales bacterium]|nr:outer membrane protein assembly factor BamD [Magnetococcales bacterium]
MSKHFLFTVLILFVLTGCSTTPDEEGESITRSPEYHYRQGVAALHRERFKAATEHFQDLDRKHPFSPWAVRGQMNLIYAWYKREEFAEAIAAAERFIRLHPRHDNAAYAFYMRGLSNFAQISDAHRDQKKTREAVVALQELVRRFPKTDYAEEAQRMMVVCRDRIAAHEVVVGRYYLDHAEYIAAARRFKRLVEDPVFSSTSYVEEALFSLVLSSLHLGLEEEARNYAVVLGHNFSDGAFYGQSVAMLAGGKAPSTSALNDMRPDVEEDSLLRQFMGGMTPGMLPQQMMGN